MIDDGDWSVSGNNIHNANDGNVGIGISNATEKLEVVGNLIVRNTGNTSTLKILLLKLAQIFLFPAATMTELLIILSIFLMKTDMKY